MKNLDYLIKNAQFTENHKVVMKNKVKSTVNPNDQIIINGLRFTTGTKKGKKTIYKGVSKNYYIAKYQGKTIRLHQYVYLCYNNYITPLDIHHRDEDIYNNSIDNLVALTKKEHKELHAKK